MQSLLLPLLSAFALSCALTYYLANPRAVLRIVDHPNERSLHDRPTPRTGGLAVLLGAAVASIWVGVTLGAEHALMWVGAGAAALGGVSFLDDSVDLPALLRLLVHAGAAVTLVAAGLVIAQVDLPGLSWRWPASVAALITVFYVVWMINLYNFMDGMDGFAGGMTVIGFATLGLLGWMQHALLFAGACWAIAASALGFLVWNFPPARIFMGDAGSSTLGFLVAACSIWAAQNKIAPLWVSILVFSPFIVDATLTLVRRLIRGEAVWKAHRSHYYQRLAVAGWGHRRTVLWEYALMVACAASSILVVRVDHGAPWVWFVLAGWALAYIVLAAVADRYAPFGKEDAACQGS